MVGLVVCLERPLQLTCRHPLFLKERAEDRELEHVTKVQLCLPSLEVELHTDLLHLDVTKEFALLRRLAYKFVHGMDEADHLIVIVYRYIQGLAISTN